MSILHVFEVMSDIGTIPLHEYTSKVITDRMYSGYFQSIPPKFLSHALISKKNADSHCVEN